MDAAGGVLPLTCFTGTEVQILTPPLSQLDAINNGEEERDEGCASLDTDADDTDAADSHADAHVCSICMSYMPVYSICIMPTHPVYECRKRRCLNVVYIYIYVCMYID